MSYASCILATSLRNQLYAGNDSNIQGVKPKTHQAKASNLNTPRYNAIYKIINAKFHVFLYRHYGSVS